MWSRLPGASILAAAMLAAGPANAWLLYPDRDDPTLTIVEIEKSTGETVAISALPVPFASAPESERRNPVFLWSYERLANAQAFFLVDERGTGKFQLEFAAREQSQELRFGAVVVMIGNDDTALHAFYARADLAKGAFPNGTLRYEIDFSIDRPPHWWQSVTKITFFKMTYYPIQDLDDGAVWQAMHRAVEHVTKGQGSKQIQK